MGGNIPGGNFPRTDNFDTNNGEMTNFSRKPNSMKSKVITMHVYIDVS